jgi:hypothetical protein
MTTAQPGRTLPDDESPLRRRVRRILTTIVILLCMVGLVIAAQHTRRGDEDEATITGVQKSVVELLAPTPESNVLSQAQVTIDLSPAYDARLTINGVAVPDAQVQKRPELNQVTFVPGTGKVLEKFGAGRNCVEATIFRIDGAPEDIAPARWCFNVT